METNLIDSLMDSGLDMFLLDSLCHLGGKDLLNAQLVCKKWRQFIGKWVLRSQSGRHAIRNIIHHNWRRGNASTEILNLESGMEVFDIRFDQKHVFVGSRDGILLVYDAKDLTSLYSHREHVNGCVQMAFDEDVIVSVGEFAHVILTDRMPFRVLQVNRRSAIPKNGCHTEPIWGVALRDKVVVTGGEDGDINVFRLVPGSETGQPEVRFCLQFQTKLSYHQNGITHLEMDSHVLLSGSSDHTMRAYSWDEKRVTRTFRTEYRILCVALRWPIAVSCSTKQSQSHAVKIWHLVQSCQEDDVPLRQLKIWDCLDMRMTANWLVIGAQHAKAEGQAAPLNENNLAEPDEEDNNNDMGGLEQFNAVEYDDSDDYSDSDYAESEFPSTADIFIYNVDDLLNKDRLPNDNELPRSVFTAPCDDDICLGIEQGDREQKLMYVSLDGRDESNCIVVRDFWLC